MCQNLGTPFHRRIGGSTALTTNLTRQDVHGGDSDTITHFETLQQKLVPLWHSIEQFTQDAQTIVVVPSLSVDSSVQGVKLQAYEERYLFLLLLLRQARARLIYVTSQAIHPDVVDYYLGLLPGVIGSHAKKRLFLVSPLDGSPRPLTEKLLERPRMIELIRSLVLDPDRAHLVPYNTTPGERELAVRIGIPMFGADPKFFPFGTKSGARRVFAEEGVLHPLGVENLRTADDVVDAILEMRGMKPTMKGVIVKLNEGVSGEGNATVELTNITSTADHAERAAVVERVRAMRFEFADTRYDNYMARLADRGGIVEERITGREFRSPSAQLRVTPVGVVEPLSTHDQLLGGPTGQIYLGCRFPADAEYAPAIMRQAMKVGRRLMREGVLGRFAIDFVTVRNERNEWEIFAIEINLRKGGTTHPFLTLQFLTDGSYDAERAVFTTARGEPKYFVATDHLQSPAYRVFTHDDLFDLVARHGLHFDHARQQGVVFHMLNAIGEEGLVGLTAVGNTREEAEAIYQQTVQMLDRESQLAAAENA
jgi:pheganomycin biosynthesis PGM1-like protein